MNLLAAKLYDPAGAVTKATSALRAMTAFDTTNLRLAVTVPAHGMVTFRIRCNLSGATTMPQVLLGVLNGATVVGRQVPQGSLPGTAAATTNVSLWTEFTVTGLTPGSTNFDAAYGVETVVASTNIHYGGPNNTTGNDAWGGLLFEAWDPQPQTTTGQLSVDADGRVDVIKVAGTTQTAGDIMADTNDIQTRLPAALVSGRMDCSVGAMASNVVTAGAINAAALNGKGDWNIGKTGYALSSAGVQAIWDALTSALTTVGSIGKKLADWTVGTIDTYTGNTKQTGDAYARLGAPAGASVSADVAAVKAKTDNIPASPAAVSDIPTATQNADALLNRDMSVVSDTNARSPLNALRAIRNKWTISGGTLTVKKEDDTTSAWTSALTTTVGADPITESDPA